MQKDTEGQLEIIGFSWH